MTRPRRPLRGGRERAASPYRIFRPVVILPQWPLLPLLLLGAA